MTKIWLPLTSSVTLDKSKVSHPLWGETYIFTKSEVPCHRLPGTLLSIKKYGTSQHIETGTVTCTQVQSACGRKSQTRETGAEVEERNLVQLPAIWEMGDFSCLAKAHLRISVHVEIFIKMWRESRTKRSGGGECKVLLLLRRGSTGKGGDFPCLRVISSNRNLWIYCRHLGVFTAGAKQSFLPHNRLL